MSGDKSLNPRKKGKIRKSRFGFNSRLLILLISLILLSLVIFILTQIRLNSLDDSQTKVDLENKYNDLESAVKPFEGEKFTIGRIFDKPFWGTLNSGHYFGLKLANPNPIETSLLWFEHNLNDQLGLDIRHLCNQHDGIKSYSWLRHDFHNFGQQYIEDKGYRIETSFVKNSNDNMWIARINVEIINSNAGHLKPLSVIQYITTTHPNDRLRIEKYIPASDSQAPSFIVKGDSNEINTYRMDIKINSGRDQVISTNFVRSAIDQRRMTISGFLSSKIEQTSINGTILYEIRESKKTQQTQKEPNFIAYQVNVRGPCSIDIILNPTDNFTTTDYDLRLRESILDFDNKFSENFQLTHNELNGNQTTHDLERLTKVALSNMLGSVGYFHGLSVIGKQPVNQHRYLPYGPIELLTAVPSRSFFPRGFLWDEAFHNLLISHWDPGLSNTIIKSWFDIMNVNGWIPREVILGAESMRRVPQEFIIQYISNANPPAMFIVLERMLHKKTLSSETFDHIYPRLKTWYNWFVVTQSGMKPLTYRWRGRDELSVSMLNPKTLTSGLDDYPRSSHPSDDEYHIDLRCWLTLATRTLRDFALQKGDKTFLGEMEAKLNSLTDQKLLDDLHWSDQHQMYCDFGHNTRNVELVKVKKFRNRPHGDGLEEYTEYQRISTKQPEFGCVPEFGYVSLFPMIFNLIEPTSDKLGILLDRMTDPSELWSPYGIRSLSMKSKFYNKYNTEHDRPYWRGAIWINLNYLILSSLHNYSQMDGPYSVRCQKIFEELRQNLVNNVLNEFSRTNYIWENYNDRTGQGQGSHPFTGWSSLISLIASSNRP